MGALRAAPYNPRRISPEAAAALARSMAEFGDISGFVWNVRSGHLVCGHQRRDQLPKKAKIVKTDSASDDVGTVGYGYAEAEGTRWPVRFVDWPREKERAANVAANNPLLAGEFTVQVKDILGEISLEAPDLFGALRLDEIELDLLDTTDPPSPGETDPDAIPEPPDDAVSVEGAIYRLGDHRLMCGDSGSVKDLDVLLAGEPVHLVNTDPPYNVKVEPRSNNAIASGLSSFSSTHHQGFDLARGKSKSRGTTQKMRPKDRPLEGDFLSEEEFAEKLRAWFGQMARVLEPGRSFYCWGGYANIGNYPPALKECGLYFSQGIVWDKQWPVLTRKDFMGAFELCFYGWREGAGHKFFGPNNAEDLWHVRKIAPPKMVHLTEKPVELAVRPIQYSSRPGENILDLFGGSGSTLIACEQTGRRCYAMEIDALYCDVIVQRWEQFTGRKAERRH